MAARIYLFSLLKPHWRGSKKGREGGRVGGRYYLTKTKSTAEESRPGEIKMDSGRWEAEELSDIAEKR